MSESQPFELRITPIGMFYTTYGQIRHFARKEAIQEIIWTHEGLLITLLGAGADQFEIPIPFEQGQEVLLTLRDKGWPLRMGHAMSVRWPIESDEVPF